MRCSHIHVMLLATIAYVVCILGIILMYIWYTPETTCLLNIFFITWTLVLLQLMTSVSLHPKVSFNPPRLFQSIWAFRQSHIHKIGECCFSKVSCNETGECWLIDSGVYGALCCVPLLVCHKKACLPYFF